MKNRKEFGFSPDWANQMTTRDDIMCGRPRMEFQGNPKSESGFISLPDQHF